MLDGSPVRNEARKLDARTPAYGRVIVVGSANEDLVVRVRELPTVGATVLAEGVRSFSGGKGANQAVAAARVGAPTWFVGSVGGDQRGQRLRTALAEAKVGITELAVSDQPTGLAIVLVTDHGDNAIVVAAGANSALEPEHVERGLSDIGPLDVVVVQCEIPASTVARTIELCAAAGARVILNLAPFVPFDASVLKQAWLVVVNETEASDLLGGGVAEQSAAAAIRDRFGVGCIATLGAGGSVLAARDGSDHIVPAHPARVVDTTGAGDVYVGVLAAAMVTGAELSGAMSTATAAASIAVERRGAQASFPTRAEVLARAPDAFETDQFGRAIS
jgi:ribokinase